MSGPASFIPPSELECSDELDPSHPNPAQSESLGNLTPLSWLAVAHWGLGLCPGLPTCSPQIYWGESRTPAWAGLWSVVMLGAPVMTVDTGGGRWPVPSISIAPPIPWGCPADMLDVPRYGPGERTWLLSNPTLGEGNGVEPAGPIVGPVKYAVMPHPIPRRGDACDALSPLKPPPCWGEAWVVSLLSLPLRQGRTGPQTSRGGSGLR